MWIPLRVVAGVVEAAGGVEAAVAEVEGRDTGTGRVLGAAVEDQHEQGLGPDPDPLLSGHQSWERRRGARL